MFGPFILDALADASRLGMGEVSKASEACQSRKLELEADAVSVRLMSLAGFDPRRAIDFWEERLNDSWALDADAVRVSGAMPTASFWSPHGHPRSEEEERGMMKGGGGASGGGGGGHGSHPLGSERVRRLRGVLDDWEEARRTLRQAHAEAKEIEAAREAAVVAS